MPADHHKKVGFIYFIQAIPDGPIKIGWSRVHPDSRLLAIRRMSPVRIKPLGIIRAWSQSSEAEHHRRFGATRLHGEWFEPSEDLLAYIAAHAKPWPKDSGYAPEPTPDRARAAHEKQLAAEVEWAFVEEKIRRNIAMNSIEYFI